MLPEPPAIPAFIYGSYLTLALLHLLEAKFLRIPPQLMRDDFIGTPWINLIGVPIALYYVIAIRLGIIHFGWHHMIEGLILWLIPLTSIRIWGAAYVLDELIYYNEIRILPWHPVTGGFDDMTSRNSKLSWLLLGGMAFIEVMVRKYLWRPNA
ncbi:hypothetical protein J7M22_14945 [Candidatus Poribacteria bacterium]|nr:hypothetical protein [Candidatus Poribacteria bacterium]